MSSRPLARTLTGTSLEKQPRYGDAVTCKHSGNSRHILKFRVMMHMTRCLYSLPTRSESANTPWLRQRNPSPLLQRHDVAKEPLKIHSTPSMACCNLRARVKPGREDLAEADGFSS